MGILDDAIRQHLELKRRHGAESEDLERLENEAFGPATRPGDPEFAEPDTGTSEAASAESPLGVEDVAPSVPREADDDDIPSWLSSEDATTVAPATRAEEPGTEAEQARVEHAELGDTADHPAPKQLGPEDEAEAPPPAPAPSPDPPEETEAPAVPPVEPPEAPESAIFDAPADEFDFGDLDLDLDEGSGTPAPSSPSGDPEEKPPSPAKGEPGSATDEDLLEETPDFLQETPEGEDLWFEQGPPKDFDFDDDDEK